MSGKTWDRQWQIFHEALKKPEKERSSFLEEACKGDDDLRKEVESLLAEDEEDSSFLEHPAFEKRVSSIEIDEDLGKALSDTYTIEEHIGRGGMGDLYRATRRGLGGKWAIKVLSPELSRNERVVERFRIEAKIGATLQHPNIVKVVDVGQTGRFHYLVMGYIEGEDLKNRIQRRGPLSEQESVSIGLHICKGLECAHENGIFHRDLKPSNVRIDKWGTVVVLDFGIARARDQVIRTHTMAGEVLGTPLYMSPEQIERRPVDQRSDFYSLGMVLYEMTAGSHPFRNVGPHAIYGHHLTVNPPLLIQVVPSTSREFSDLVARLIQKSPEDRPSSAAEIIKMLRDLGASDIRTQTLVSVTASGATTINSDNMIRRISEAVIPGELSARQEEILQLVGDGRSATEVLKLSGLEAPEFNEALSALVELGAVVAEPRTEPLGTAESLVHSIILTTPVPRVVRGRMLDIARKYGPLKTASVALGMLGTFLIVAIIGSYSVLSSAPPIWLAFDASPYAAVEVVDMNGEISQEGETPFRAAVAPGNYEVIFRYGELLKRQTLEVNSETAEVIREDFLTKDELDEIVRQVLGY